MSEAKSPDSEPVAAAPAGDTRMPARPAEPRPREIGGRASGLDPTRYSDWEKNGRCIDF